MANAPGRNAPCPCGSGRKYKNCCLPADEARERAARASAPAAGAVSVWDDPAELDDEFEDDFDPPGSPGWPPDDPLVAAQSSLWEQFAAAEYEDQIRLFQEALQGATLDADLAFEMLAQIEAEAQERGELGRFGALVDKYAHEAPALYAEDAVHYASWLIETALATGDLARLPAALEPFARDPAAGLGELFRVADQLLYYDQTAPLLDTLRRGWQPLTGAADVHPELVEVYAALLAEIAIVEYARMAGTPRADDPRLAEQLAAYLEPKAVQSVQLDAAALLGTLSRQWHARDFESAPRAEPRERRLDLLAHEWAGDLWRQEGVSLGRAVLGSQVLAEYLVEGAGKGKSAQTMLVPARRRLERFLKDHFDVSDYREYRAGALVELLPYYLDFLVRRGLIDASVVGRTLAELRPVQSDLVQSLTADRADAGLIAAIRERWAARE
jgi:hypothetical protein